MGRSTDAGSFVILTRAFQEVELKSDFVPIGCSSSMSQNVLRLGAGVVAQDLYAEAAKLGVVTTGGFCPTVGIAGGFALGGGAAGPFQPVIGMGADSGCLLSCQPSRYSGLMTNAMQMWFNMIL